MKISVVVPTYNGHHRLPALCAQIVKALKDDPEIVVVDDGSRVGPEELVRDLRNDGVDVKGVVLRRNYGQQLATLAGLRVSTGDYIFTVDDDLAHHPEHFAEMLALAERAGLDAVYGVPARRNQGILRNIGSRLRDIVFILLFRKPAGISVTSFRLLRRSLAAQILDDLREYRYLSVEILKRTQKIGNLKVGFQASSGNSHPYGFLKLVSLGFSIVRSSPAVPARLRRAPEAASLEYRVI